MYRSGPNFEFGEKPVPKWYVPKWSCTELALTPIKNVASDVLHRELRPTFPGTSCGDLENCFSDGGLDSRVMKTVLIHVKRLPNYNM